MLGRCHRRARKSTLALNLIIREARRHPNHMYHWLSPTLSQAISNIWHPPDMLFKWLPPRSEVPWTMNKSYHMITFPNGSIIKLGGTDKIGGKKRGQPANGVVFDEFSESDHPEVWQEVYRPMLAESKDRWGWILATPKGRNHLYDVEMKYRDYIAEYGGTEGDTTVIVLPASKSGILSKDELQRARLDMRPEVYRQEMEVEYLVSTDMVLIPLEDVERLRSITLGEPHTRRIISIDVAFEGDECVLMAFENTRIIDMEILQPRKHTDIVSAAYRMAERLGIYDFIVDYLAEGRDVCNDLEEVPRFNVQRFDSRGESTDDMLGNRRAQAWWYTSELIRYGKVAYPEDSLLVQQLTNMLFVMKQRKIYMERKREYKKHSPQHSSPDRADAFVMGLWGLQSVNRADESANQQQESYISSMKPMAAMTG